MLGIYQPYEYSWMFSSNLIKYIWQLTKNIAAIVIQMVGIHIHAELINTSNSWFSVNLQYNIGQETTIMSVSSNFFLV